MAHPSTAPAPDTPARPAVGTPGLIKRDGRAIQYFTQPGGRTVVLIASLGREASDFNELASALADAGYGTVAVEAPGIGASDFPEADLTLHDLAGDVAAVLDAEGITEKVAMLGHAFGNRVARTFAHDTPDSTRAAILVAAGGQRPVPDKANASLRSVFDGTLSADMRDRHIRYAFFAGDNPIPDHWRVGWYGLTAMLQGTASRLMGDEPWQRAGGVPMLVIQADADTVAPKEDAADYLAASLPDQVTTVIIENAGHALLPEQPEAIATAVLAFLDELS